jgi:flavin reductase
MMRIIPTMTRIERHDDAPDHDDEMLNRVPPLVPPPGGADGPVVDALRFRDGMSRVAASVHVVTTDGPAGRAGFTATAVAPVTDSPASLLVCIDAAGRSARALAENGVVCVNTLAVSDRALADAFAGRSGLSGEARFSAGRWGSLATGAPALETSLVAFDCRLVEARLVATHYVVVGAVVEVRLGPAAAALAYRERGYHGL